MLTDGSVSNRERVIAKAKEHCETARVFTFGLGSGCDKRLVTDAAKAGRGTHTFAEDGGVDLNAKVIRALNDAMEPSFKGVSYGWNGESEVSGQEIYRNALVHSTALVASEEEFSKMSFAFKTEADAESGQQLDLTFGAADFRKVEGAGAEALFKMAAFNKLESIKLKDRSRVYFGYYDEDDYPMGSGSDYEKKKAEKVALSVKY